MKSLIRSVSLCVALGMPGVVFAEQPVPEQLQLKDGSTLYLHPDGTSRMVDVHGKPTSMADGVEMELADGRIIMMKNHKVWIQHGPPGKGPKVMTAD